MRVKIQPASKFGRPKAKPNKEEPGTGPFTVVGFRMSRYQQSLHLALERGEVRQGPAGGGLDVHAAAC